MSRRIEGYDVARALAVFGMVIVNFKIVMGLDKAGPHALATFAGLFEGRAVATFVVLAGAGLALLSRRAIETGDAVALATSRRRLLKRAVFLFVVGLVYTPLWPADILHFYGIYIAIGALLLTASDRRLLLTAAAFVLAFVVLILVFDYETGWDFETLTYSGFWSAAGMVRHLFFNGFHPAVPWTAFLLVGIWLGRRDLEDEVVARRTLAIGLGLAVVAETASWLLVRWLSTGADAETREVVEALAGTAPMPPMPLYMLAGTGVALAVISAAILFTKRFPTAPLVAPLVATGQLALTLYVAHVILGMGTLEALGRLERQTPEFAMTAAAIFCIAAVVFSWAWKKRFRHGPLEWVMRRVTG